MAFNALVAWLLAASGNPVASRESPVPVATASLQADALPTGRDDLVVLADRSFLTQYTSAYNPDAADLYAANCGPASLAMVLRALDVAPKVGPQTLIDDARIAMTGSDQTGSWTYPDQILAAAPRFGLAAREVHGIEAVRAAETVPGHLVILNLNPGPAYADRLDHPFDGGHFAVVIGFVGRDAILDDPMAKAPALRVSTADLEKALTADLGPGIPAYDGGVELWRASVPSTAMLASTGGSGSRESAGGAGAASPISSGGWR